MTTPPNILLITTDQQRFDTVGEAAPDFLCTPHLDHLLREGVHFRRAYAETPICVPARASIMTGRSVFEHGLTYNGPTSSVMGRDDTTPALLRRLGYATTAIGKMHFTPQRARHGFDEMLLPEDYYRWAGENGLRPMRTGLGQNELYPGMATVPEAWTLTSWIADECVRYVRERRDPTVPFFLWASFSKPHPPLDPPEPYASMYRDAPIPDPTYGEWCADERCPEAFLRQRQRGSYDLITRPVIRAARAAYLGLITHIDYAIGRIFAGLQDVGLLDDCLIIFTSDHGEFLGDHLAGGKVMFHEPSARIPFILRLPKSRARRWCGRVNDALVTHTDVLPTLVAAAGGAAPDHTDGRNLIDLLEDRTPPRGHLCAVATERGEPTPIHLAITDGRWKYIWYPEGGQEQLFDLENDPRECVDVSTASPERDRLHALLVTELDGRQSPWVADGRLVRVPLRGDSVADRRATSWPGYHTEAHGADVRH